MDSTLLVILLLKLMASRLETAIHTVEARLPEDLMVREGNGSMFDPYRDTYPVLDPLWVELREIGTQIEYLEGTISHK